MCGVWCVFVCVICVVVGYGVGFVCVDGIVGNGGGEMVGWY